MILSYTVPDGENRKVHTILRRELRASAALVRKLKLANAIFANGESVFTDKMLSPGDVLTADITAAEAPCDVVPEEGEISIIYEDEGMLVVNKPCGILVHPSRAKYTGTLSNFAAGYLLEKEGNGTVHAVNRLDRDTGGVVVFAKNSYMKALLSEALEETGEKKYFAVVHGKMPEENGTIDAPIMRLREGDMMRGVSPEGQRAITHYKTIGQCKAEGEDISLLNITLETGRTHQIRVHCTHFGCPLLGDCLYYTEESCALSEKLGVGAQLLHAVMLTFRHPLTGKEHVFNAPVMREDMRKVLELFE